MFNHQSGEHLEIDGAKIYYEITGNNNGPVLLFLHGGFGNIEIFNNLLPALNKDYKILGIDSRGQGKSTLGSEPLTYERIQKDAERILKHLGINKVSITGFSDGGIVAYRLASLTKLTIEKLITIGSRWHLKNTEPMKENFLKITGERRRIEFPNIYESYQRLNPMPDFDTLAESLVKMWLDPNFSGYPNEAVSNISCPLLIVRGDEDHLLSREDVVELSGLVRESVLLNIPFAGHAAYEDQKKIFTAIFKEFLFK